MKTSLNIDDSIFEAARKEAEKRGTTIGQTLSSWALLGRKALRARGKEARAGGDVEPIDLGGPARIDLSSRRDWIDLLDA